MTPIHISPPKQSGTKSWTVVTADTQRELNKAAQHLKTEIHQKGEYQSPHLDLTYKQVERIQKMNDAG